MNPEQFYYTENYVASFPDDICGVNPAQKCNRPYKHTLQHHLLSTHLVKEVYLPYYYYYYYYYSIVWLATNKLTINTPKLNNISTVEFSNIYLITERKRSLGKGNVFTPVCNLIISFCSQGVSIPACNRGMYTPPSRHP